MEPKEMSDWTTTITNPAWWAPVVAVLTLIVHVLINKRRRVFDAETRRQTELESAHKCIIEKVAVMNDRKATSVRQVINGPLPKCVTKNLITEMLACYEDVHSIIQGIAHHLDDASRKNIYQKMNEIEEFGYRKKTELSTDEAALRFIAGCALGDIIPACKFIQEKLASNISSTSG